MLEMVEGDKKAINSKVNGLNSYNNGFITGRPEESDWG